MLPSKTRKEKQDLIDSDYKASRELAVKRREAAKLGMVWNRVTGQMEPKPFKDANILLRIRKRSRVEEELEYSPDKPEHRIQKVTIDQEDKSSQNSNMNIHRGTAADSNAKAPVMPPSIKDPEEQYQNIIREDAKGASRETEQGHDKVYNEKSGRRRLNDKSNIMGPPPNTNTKARASKAESRKIVKAPMLAPGGGKLIITPINILPVSKLSKDPAPPEAPVWRGFRAEMTALLAARDSDDTAETQEGDQDGPKSSDMNIAEEESSKPGEALPKPAQAASATSTQHEKKKLKIYIKSETVSALKAKLEKSRAGKSGKRKREEEEQKTPGTEGLEAKRLKRDEPSAGNAVGESSGDKAVETTSQIEGSEVDSEAPIVDDTPKPNKEQHVEPVGSDTSELDTSSAPSSDLGRIKSNGQLEGGKGRLKRRRESDSSDDTSSKATKRTKLDRDTAETTPEQEVEENEEEL